MAFLNHLNQLKSTPLPPIKNVLNVAWQTAKQTIPDKNKKQQYEEPSSDYGGSSQGAPSVASHGSHRHIAHQHVSFADSVDGMPSFDTIFQLI
jgi:vesicular inhibitory amino acid transporter